MLRPFHTVILSTNDNLVRRSRHHDKERGIKETVYYGGLHVPREELHALLRGRPDSILIAVVHDDNTWTLASSKALRYEICAELRICSHCMQPFKTSPNTPQ